MNSSARLARRGKAGRAVEVEKIRAKLDEQFYAVTTPLDSIILKTASSADAFRACDILLKAIHAECSVENGDRLLPAPGWILPP